MTTVTIEEAQARLPELIEKAAAGEEVVIVRGLRSVVRLQLTHEASVSPRPRRAGSGAASILHIADDFDAPLEDFKEYME